MDKIDQGLLGALLSAEDDTKPAGECPMPKKAFPEEMPLAMAYVPFQTWQKPYDSAVALERGTIPFAIIVLTTGMFSSSATRVTSL